MYIFETWVAESNAHTYKYKTTVKHKIGLVCLSEEIERAQSRTSIKL
jgi:hypothetical protein